MPRRYAVLWTALLGICYLFLRGAPGRPPELPGPPSGPLEAVVERVVDGDTAVLSTGVRVRYIGVDTPELHHPRKPVEPFAREAKEFNRRLVEGKKVRLELDVQRYDRYHRLLAYLFLADGTFVNSELLRQGYAQLLTIPPNVKYADLFVENQREAREAGRGLWRKRRAVRIKE
ncbi:MAG: thermonuclease family protein [Candidatus Omnitrophica bacterium]|nr:thermonuclease family protein [Candidatus Omnitrophota bacterium]